MNKLAKPLRASFTLALLALLAVSFTTAMVSVPLADARPQATEKTQPKKKARAKKVLTGKLNLNTATVAELKLLPGVGATKAARVVEWRKDRGSFKRVKDLRRVKGFGYKSLKRLAPHLTVKGKTTLRKE